MDKWSQLSVQNKTERMPKNASCKRWDALGIAPVNRVCFPTSTVCLLCRTQARRVFQRGQQIQALAKDRCSLLHNFGNSMTAPRVDTRNERPIFEGKRHRSAV